VVGAGPVGLMLAGELRLGGARVTVLERRTEPSTESRASTLHARTMEILDQRGLLAAVGTPPNDPMGHFGGLPLDLGEQSSPYPGQWKVPQTELVRILTEWAVGLGADLRMGHEVSAVTQADDSVVVRYQGPGASDPSGAGELTAAFVVGCDGEDSTVRELAGIGFPGRDARRELVRADVTGIDVPNRRFQRLPAGLAIAATRNGVTRVMVHEFGAEAAPRSGDPGFDEIAKTWHRVTGEDISHGVPTWRNAFGDARRQAVVYRAGRVLLAGDAAHRQMPIGGQAVNLGVQDAVNLGWKLAAEVRGTAPDGLLDSYHQERHQVGRSVLNNIEAQATLLLGGPEVEPVRTVLGELLRHAEVRAQLGAAVCGLDIRYGEGEEPLVGRRMPHLVLSGAIGPDQGVGPASTTAALRAARGVLLDLSGDARRRMALSAISAGWSGRVDLVAARAAGPLTADTDHAAPALPDTVLIRPDGHVAWVGDRDSDPATALAHWFGPVLTQIR
jgi:oxygenase